MLHIIACARRLVGMGLVFGAVAAHPASADNQQSSYTIPAEKLERFIDYHLTDDFSGTLLIAQNGKILHAKGYGFANRAEGTANTPDTIFAAGGLTRYFTAAAVLKLVEQDKLALDDTLPAFFEGVPESKQTITVHHLLTHTPGLFGDDERDVFKPASTNDLLEDVFSAKNSIKPAIYTPTFTFQPGERSIEFSEGYSLLAEIVEKRSGQSFEAFLNAHFFKPAGMSLTGYREPDWSGAQIAVGYEGDTAWGTVSDRLADHDAVPTYMKGSIGILTTVNDLLAWHSALNTGKILREDLVSLLHTRHIGSTLGGEADIDNGYGILLSETWTGTPWIMNEFSSLARTSLPPFRFRYHYFPVEDTVIIYGANAPVSGTFSEAMPALIRTLLEPDYVPAAHVASQQ